MHKNLYYNRIYSCCSDKLLPAVNSPSADKTLVTSAAFCNLQFLIIYQGHLFFLRIPLLEVFKKKIDNSSSRSKLNALSYDIAIYLFFQFFFVGERPKFCSFGINFRRNGRMELKYHQLIELLKY